MVLKTGKSAAIEASKRLLASSALLKKKSDKGDEMSASKAIRITEAMGSSHFDRFREEERRNRPKPWQHNMKHHRAANKIHHKLPSIKSYTKEVKFHPKVGFRVQLRLESKMGSDEIKLSSHRYMKELSEKIVEDEMLDFEMRKRERVEKEEERQRELAISGMIEVEPHSPLARHPMLRCNQIMKRLRESEKELSITPPLQMPPNKIVTREPFGEYANYGILFPEHPEHYKRKNFKYKQNGDGRGSVLDITLPSFLDHEPVTLAKSLHHKVKLERRKTLRPKSIVSSNNDSKNSAEESDTSRPSNSSKSASKPNSNIKGFRSRRSTNNKKKSGKSETLLNTKKITFEGHDLFTKASARLLKLQKAQKPPFKVSLDAFDVTDFLQTPVPVGTVSTLEPLDIADIIVEGSMEKLLRVIHLGNEELEEFEGKRAGLLEPIFQNNELGADDLYNTSENVVKVFKRAQARTDEFLTKEHRDGIRDATKQALGMN